MRVLVGGSIIYGVAGESADMPRQLFNVAPATGLRGRTAWQPRMVPAVGPAIDPALYVGQQEVAAQFWSPEQFGVPVQFEAEPQGSSFLDSTTGFLGVMAGAAFGYAASTFSRQSRARGAVMMNVGNPPNVGTGQQGSVAPVMNGSNSNFAPTGSGPSLMPREEDLNSTHGAKRLSEALTEKDTEARKDREAAEARSRQWEIKREELEAKRRLMEQIPDDMGVGTVDEYMYKGGVKDELAKLDHEMIGLVPVKDRVREIASLLVVDKMRMKLGMETGVPSLHMCFTGSPGTGKTTVAVRMGAILQRMGYCRTGHVVVATRDDLVGQYVGHTAPKTKEMVKKAMGGILLVDEAYYLYNASNDRDYGQESIEILLNVMENNKEDLVVILAGYKDKMDTFFSFTPGMQSRVGNHINFPNYEVDELVDIAAVMARELEYKIDPAAMPILKRYCERRMQLPFFSNARTVRNAVDRARMNAAIRLFEEKMQPTSNGMVTEDELSTITAVDFQTILDDAENAADDAIFA
jgi:probable Rubsico expression protein CbbX